MGLLDRRKKRTNRRDLENSDAVIIELLEGNGTEMNQTKAMEIPALAGAIERIASLVAMMPLRLYRNQAGKVEIVDDYRVNLINQDTGGAFDGFLTKKLFATDFLLYGSSYIYIDRRGNKIRSLRYVKSNLTTIVTNTDPIFLDYSIWAGGRSYRPCDFVKAFRNPDDKLSGRGIVTESQLPLKVAYLQLLFQQRQMKTNGSRRGVLTSLKKLNEGAFEKLKAAWRSLYTGQDAEQVIILNSGMEFKEISDTAAEMQLNESRENSRQDIFDLLNLPADGDRKKAIMEAVLPLLAQFETAFTNDLLLESEKKKGFYFAFDTSNELKADMLTRYQAYEYALRSNFMQIDEVRDRENMPEMGMKFIKMGLQDVLYNPQTGEIFTPNMGLKTNLQAEEQQEGGNVDSDSAEPDEDSDGQDNKLKPPAKGGDEK